jgi:hypothetical protein
MALLSRLLGHASDLTPEQTREELDGILLPEEPVEVAFKLIRDLFVFNDRRLILVDKQGVTSRKVDYLVVPGIFHERFSRHPVPGARRHGLRCRRECSFDGPWKIPANAGYGPASPARDSHTPATSAIPIAPVTTRNSTGWPSALACAVLADGLPPPSQRPIFS